MVGCRLKSSSSSSSSRKKNSAATATTAATCALPPPPSSCPDAVVAEQLHQFDLRLKQLEEKQMVRQPRPLPPSAPSPPPPPPPPTVLAPAAPVAAKAEVPFRNMRQSCFPAELRRVAVAATFGHRRRRRQPQQQVHALERQVPLHGQIRNSDQLQQQRSSSSSSSMAPIALHDANLRSSLMERLRLLENRIFQLSFELDQERNNSSRSSSRGSSSTTTATTTTTRRTRQATTWSSSDKEWPPQSMASSSTGGGDQAAAEMAIVPSASSSSFSQRRFTLGERLQGHILFKMKKPAKDSKQVATVAGNMYYCKKEKKRMERTRLYKRWFPLIGC